MVFSAVVGHQNSVRTQMFRNKRAIHARAAPRQRLRDGGLGGCNKDFCSVEPRRDQFAFEDSFDARLYTSQAAPDQVYRW